jgi:hypothetical protein
MRKRIGSDKPIEVERRFFPNNQAMLQALRVVLDLPRKPISLKEDEKTESSKIHD